MCTKACRDSCRNFSDPGDPASDRAAITREMAACCALRSRGIRRGIWELGVWAQGCCDFGAKRWATTWRSSCSELYIEAGMRRNACISKLRDDKNYLLPARRARLSVARTMRHASSCWRLCIEFLAETGDSFGPRVGTSGSGEQEVQCPIGRY